MRHEAPPSRRSAPVLRLCSLAICAGAVVGGCGGGGSPADPRPDRPAEVPARGDAATFDVATWNVEWFGDPGNGPSDEARQQRNVRDVVAGAALDLWALQEVVDEAAFDALVAAIPGYGGLLADDPSVEGGPEWYRDFGDREQKVALLYRTSVVSVLGARVILASEDFSFAGRPPLEVRVRITVDGVSMDGVVVVVHAKASDDEASWGRRAAASLALEAYLDATWPTAPVWVLGDFNDDVDTSITAGRPSPYDNFMGSPGWGFVTAALSQQGVSSTVGFPDVVDHHLVSDEVAGTYVTGSVEAFRVDRHIDDYATTTTDHYPVLARYALPGG